MIALRGSFRLIDSFAWYAAIVAHVTAMETVHMLNAKL